MLAIVDYLWNFFVHRPACWLTGEKPRSLQWPAVRRKFLRDHPTCAATGGRRNLNVHHVKSFHLDPTRELDPANLITLRRDAHFLIGHLSDWRSWNASVVEDAAALRAKIENRP